MRLTFTYEVVLCIEAYLLFLMCVCVCDLFLFSQAFESDVELSELASLPAARRVCAVALLALEARGGATARAEDIDGADASGWGGGAGCEDEEAGEEDGGEEEEAAAGEEGGDREDASSMVTAGATANTTVKNSRASRESGLLCSHSHGEYIGGDGVAESSAMEEEGAGAHSSMVAPTTQPQKLGTAPAAVQRAHAPDTLAQGGSRGAAKKATETAQGGTETAQGGTKTAQGCTETAQGCTETAQGGTETAQGATATAQGATGIVSQPAVAVAVARVAAEGAAETEAAARAAAKGAAAKAAAKGAAVRAASAAAPAALSSCGFDAERLRRHIHSLSPSLCMEGDVPAMMAAILEVS